MIYFVTIESSPCYVETAVSPDHLMACNYYPDADFLDVCRRNVQEKREKNKHWV